MNDYWTMGESWGEHENNSKVLLKYLKRND